MSQKSTGKRKMRSRNQCTVYSVVWNCEYSLKFLLIFFCSKPQFTMPKMERPKMEMPKVEIPKIDLKAKVINMNSSIRNTKVPTPQEIRDSYINSNFHKSFQQPLAVRKRVEDVDEQQKRKLLTEKKTPAQLSQMNHPLDIPLPKIRLRDHFKTEKGNSETRY